MNIDTISVYGWEGAVQAMRTPLQSWNRADSFVCSYGNCHSEICEHAEECNQEEIENGYSSEYDGQFIFGPFDYALARKLSKAGQAHSKFMRLIQVQAAIKCAPAYWWAELDTYKVGTVRVSTSLQHTGDKRDFVQEDFTVDSMENKQDWENLLKAINTLRQKYKKNPEDYQYFRRMRQLIPMSYNYTSIWGANYQVLQTIYRQRKNHKLKEWRQFCKWILTLPYSELITESDYRYEHYKSIQ